MEFEYNSLGKLSGVTYPDGSRVGYSYYKNGMISAVEGVIDNIEYDARNLPIKISYANGVEGIIQYTPGPGLVKEHRVSGPAGQVLQDIHYEYDLASHMIAAENSAPGSQFKTKYDFDAFSQLLAVHEDASGESYEHKYEYSLPGRLSFLGDTGVSFSSDVNESPDKITEITDAQGLAFPINYDMNGNLTSLPGRVLSYNFKNLLNHLDRENGSTVDYSYDYKNRLTRKRVNDNGTETDTKMLGNYAEIRNSNLAKFVLLGKLRIAIISNGNHETIHSNSLGSSTFFTDTQGNKFSEIAYHPFGNIKSKNGLLTSQMFALQYCDSESGLHYAGRRWYSPEIGRFTTPDPMVLYRPEQMMDSLIQLCPYTYGGNDPIDNIDPSGLSFWSVAGAIVGVAIGVSLGIGIILAGGWALAVAMLVAAAVVTVSYIAAKNRDGDAGEFLRGMMIGINAGLNGVLLYGIFGSVAIGVGIGVLGFLASFDTIAKNEGYQGILGWSNWLMPMSWVVLGFGILFVIFSGTSIKEVKIHWKTGNIVVHGGLIANWNTEETAFNMGNFTFVHESKDIDYANQHEFGHNLSLAAFGSVFHLVGWIDQNFALWREESAGKNAYSERIADSNDPDAKGERVADPDLLPIIPMWS
jgi:RHS repeat-associated protein